MITLSKGQDCSQGRMSVKFGLIGLWKILASNLKATPNSILGKLFETIWKTCTIYFKTKKRNVSKLLSSTRSTNAFQLFEITKRKYSSKRETLIACWPCHFEINFGQNFWSLKSTSRGRRESNLKCVSIHERMET